MFNVLLKNSGFFLVLFFLSMCSGKKTTEEVIVARVGEKKLLQKDLAEIIPDGLTENDSILMAGDYIKKWIQKELILQKAEENLSPAQKDVSNELQEYRNSLLIYKYKNELLKQRMDTTVQFGQIEEYYQGNKENFNLNKNIVKAIFIKIPDDFANREQLKSYSENITSEGLAELREYCLQYAKGFDIFVEKWVEFDVLLNNLPQEIPNHEEFLSKNKWIELTDSTYYYLVNIHDFRLRNQPAPIEYVEENIKNLLLNQRKIQFLKEIENTVYTEGIRKNKFKIYNQKTDETVQ